MEVRKHVVVSILLAGVWTFVMMVVCDWLVTMMIPIIMPLRMYTADQFVTIATALSLGVMCFGHIFLTKTGIYHSIRNHIGE